jgi:hypothetical protein|tara:strand:+ start:51 stop:437 length:387 start_codon:yes stop_codon:yes gene_type:complete
MSKELKTLNPVTIMKRLSKMLEQSIQDSDEDYFYDRLHFMKQNFDNDSDVYKSNKVEDKIDVLDYSLETINVLINQVLRFNRIVYSSENSTIYNFPKNEIPKFYIKDIFSNKTNTVKYNLNKYEGINK